jgi:hypothetical protein
MQVDQIQSILDSYMGTLRQVKRLRDIYLPTKQMLNQVMKVVFPDSRVEILPAQCSRESTFEIVKGLTSELVDLVSAKIDGFVSRMERIEDEQARLTLR